MTNLDVIAKSLNVTIKGGVVLVNISKDICRTTRDLNLDFIKYFLVDDSTIALYVDEANSLIRE